MEGQQQKQHRQHMPGFRESMMHIALNAISASGLCPEDLALQGYTQLQTTHGSDVRRFEVLPQTLHFMTLSNAVSSFLLWDEVATTHPAFHIFMSSSPTPPPLVFLALGRRNNTRSSRFFSQPSASAASAAACCPVVASTSSCLHTSRHFPITRRDCREGDGGCTVSV